MLTKKASPQIHWILLNKIFEFSMVRTIDIMGCFRLEPSYV